MSRGPWSLRHGCSTYEVVLFGTGSRDEGPDESFFVAALLDDWIHDHWAATTIFEIDRALGGERPWVLNNLSVEGYHERVKSRIRDALRLGTLRATSRREPLMAGSPPSEQPATPERAPEPFSDAEDLWLTAQTMSGAPVEDDAGFALQKPDRSSESVRLSDGEYRKTRAPRGAYQAQFTYLRDARWAAESIRSGEEVRMTVAAGGFADGEGVFIKVYEVSQLEDGQPVAELQASVSGGVASGAWRHVQRIGEPAGGRFIFEAESKGKWVASAVLRVEPHPLPDLQGVKERLVQLGYDCGAPGPDETPELKDAVKRFQDAFGFPRPDGRADECTVAALEGVL